MWTGTTIVKSLDGYQTLSGVSPVKLLQSNVQRRFSVGVTSIDVSSKRDKEIDNLVWIAEASPMKGSAIFSISGVNVFSLEVLLEQDEWVRAVSLSGHVKHVQLLVVTQSGICSWIEQKFKKRDVFVKRCKVNGPRSVVFLLNNKLAFLYRWMNLYSVVHIFRLTDQIKA